MKPEQEHAPSREEEHFYGALSLFHDVEARRLQRITHARDPKIDLTQLTHFPTNQHARTEFSNAVWQYVKESIPPEFKEHLLKTMTSIYSFDGLHHNIWDLGADWVREQNDPFLNLDSGMDVINIQMVSCLDYVVDRMLHESDSNNRNSWNGIRAVIGYNPPRIS